MKLNLKFIDGCHPCLFSLLIVNKKVNIVNIDFHTISLGGLHNIKLNLLNMHCIHAYFYTFIQYNTYGDYRFHLMG
jgi:hypothetical protein